MDLVNSGGYANVYKKRINNIDYAVKVIKINDMNKSTIQNEIDILSDVHTNEHIVSLINASFDDETCNIVMDLYDEDMLQFVTKKTRLSWEEAFEYFFQMQKAIQFIHVNRICHRDVKLENFLKKNGHIVLSDFGLAKNLKGDARNKITGTVGTLSYCPPEVLRNVPYDGFKSDIWSLGVCFVAMICGFFPFKTASFEDWRYNIFINSEHGLKDVFKEYNMNFEISEELYELFHKMLGKNPDNRINITELLRNTWTAIIMLKNV